MLWIRLRRFVLLTFALVVVLGALVAVVASYVTSQVPEYRQEIEANLAAAFGRDVQLQGLRLVWRGVYPQAQVTGLSLPADNSEISSPVSIDILHVTLDPVALIQQELKPTDILMDGVQIHWLMADGPQRSVAELRKMLTDMTGRVGDLQSTRQPLVIRLRNASLNMAAQQNPALHVALSNIAVDASIDDGVVTLTGAASAPAILSETLSFALRADAQQRIGRLSLKANGLQANANWLDSLVGHWVDVASGEMGMDATMQWQLDALQLQVDLQLQALAYQIVDDNMLTASGSTMQHVVQKMSTTIKVEHRDDMWWMRTEGLEVDLTGTASHFGSPWLAGDIELRQASDGQITGKVDYAKLDDVLPLVQPWLDQALPQVGGDLRDITFRFSPDSQDWSVWGKANNVWVADGDTNPGLSGLNGQLELTPLTGHLILSSTAFTLTESAWFAAPLVFKQLDGVLQWQYTDAKWQFELSELSTSNELGQLSGRATFDVTPNPSTSTQQAGASNATEIQASPSDQLSIQVNLSDVALPKVADYLPATFLGDELRNWFAQAFIAGSADASLDIQGPMQGFVLGENGHINVQTEYRDVGLAYLPDWPIVQAATGRLDWQDYQLHTTVENGQWADYPLTNVQVKIADLADPYIDVQAVISGPAQPILQATKQLPVAQEVFAVLAENTYTGTLYSTLDLHLGLQQQADGYVNVSTDLRDVSITEPGGMVYEKINGQLIVTDAGLQSQNLRGVVMGIPLQASLQQQFATEAVPTVTLNGVVDLASPAPGYQSVLEPLEAIGLLQQLSGAADWQADLAFNTNNPETVKLTIASDMRGVESRLVGMFAKSAEDIRPLQIVIQQQDAKQRTVLLRWHNALAANIQLQSSDSAGGLRKMALDLGQSEIIPALPSTNIMQFTGFIDQFDWQQWDFFAESDGVASATSTAESATSLPLVIENLQVNEFNVYGSNLGSFGINLQAHAGVWGLQVDGDRVAGQLGNNTPSQVIAGHLTRLHLPALSLDNLNERDKTNEPAGQKEHASQTQSDDQRLPTAWPLLDISADNVKIGEFNYGAITIKNQITLTGRELQISNAGGEAELQAALRWDVFTDKTQVSDLQLKLVTNHMAKLLAGLGYDQILLANEAEFLLHASWDASPENLSMAALYGDLNFTLQDGALEQVDPGLGRLVGLLNVYRLPERLIGNFRDMTETGMAFDQLSGTFRFADGEAYSSDLQIASAAADATFIGRVGLEAQDYDIHARIQPKLSGGVGLAGAILAGLSTGGVLLLAQEIFTVPLQELTEIRYHLAGDWQNPTVSDLTIESEEYGEQNFENLQYYLQEDATTEPLSSPLPPLSESP